MPLPAAVVHSKKRELALQKQMPGQEERMKWKGLAARLRSILLHSLRAGRDLERKERGLSGLLLGPAARSLQASKELSVLSLTSLLRGLRAERVG